ncbi:hypothetical protein QYE76_010710 [Lolium multiflorum]|uniref:CCHC-type domain-containing protein n=1 Tax=Lolium multiflorum TaxID=4521 RepID=A0AAD8TXK8_LOLMU|nr:hypothetical protein QYE76_010710 [Lolium multiflorum]
MERFLDMGFSSPKDPQNLSLEEEKNSCLDALASHVFSIVVSNVVTSSIMPFGSAHELWTNLQDKYDVSKIIEDDCIASTSGRDEFSSSSTSPKCEETKDSIGQDKTLKGASSNSSSLSHGPHICLMAKGSTVPPTMEPNMSRGDKDEDEYEEEDWVVSLRDKEEIKELKAQVTSLKNDLVKGHEGKCKLDMMLSMQQSPNDKSGLGFKSNNKNKSKNNNKKKGQVQVKDPAKIVCFKCNIEGHHVRSCPLKKKQNGKRPQAQTHIQPQVVEMPLPKKKQANAPIVEKPSEKKEKKRTCYICREKGHISSLCTIGTSSNSITIDDVYSLRKDEGGNVFAKFVGAQSGVKKRTIWVAKPIVTNLLGPNLVGDQQSKI